MLHFESPNAQLCFIAAFVAVFLGTLQFLSIILVREKVKADLNERICEPLSVRWIPLSWHSSSISCCFRVVYRDFRGQIHRGECEGFHWGREIRWLRDDIVGGNSTMDV
jgi:hypothetical protein